MADDYLRSYLVSLGYEVDTASLSKAMNSLDQMTKAVGGFINSLQSTAAITAVTTAVYELTKTLEQFTIGAASAELQTEMFARKMWMNYDAALSYKSSLQALGVTLQDLYLSPELMNKFIALRNQAGQMGPPTGYQDAMKGIRDITFEFARLKLEISYSGQWISFYLSKYLSAPAGDFLKTLRNLNDWITQNMPRWTAKVAEVISWVGKLYNAAYLAGKEIVMVWNGMGDSSKKLIEIFTAVEAAVWALALPFAPVMAAITALLLLIDDYYVFEKTKGKGETAFPGLWQWLDQLKKSMQDNGEIRQFKQSIDDLAKAIAGLGTALLNLFQGTGGTATSWAQTVKNALKTVIDMIQALTGAIQVLNGVLSGDSTQVKQGAQKIGDAIPGANNLQERQALIQQGFANQPAWITNVENWARGKLGMPNLPGTGKTTVITLSPTYYISESGDAGATAKAIQGTNYALLMRGLQGVVQ
ncbi:MAG: hypothetical protein ABSC17_09900 [Thermacetogeniaceae bacterium]